jgi:hypothetical protein
MTTPTTPPAATAPAAATTPATPAFATTVSDVTPAESRVHRVEILAADLAAFIALIDPTAPAGHGVRSFFGSSDAKGDLLLTITYVP